MSPEYPLGLVTRLLSGWDLLCQGKWPSEETMPEGYRGERTEEAPFEEAIIAKADVEAAVGRLAGYQRHQVGRWLAHGTGEPPWWMVQAVWGAL